MKKLSKYVSLGLLSVGLLGSLAACGDSGSKEASSSGKNADGKYEKTLTIDVFDDLANNMGMSEGWFAEVVKDKFNIEMNLIAPNVAGNGDTLYQTRTSAGDLGDLIITGQGERYDELVEAGLLLDASDYYKDMKNIAKFDEAVEKVNEDQEGIFGFPTGVSTLSATTPSEALDPTFGAYLRWDLYKEQGYPEIKELEDLLPVLEKMQQDHPQTDNGKKVYAFSLFSDWDGNMMNAGKQMSCFYGYDELGFVLAKADGSDYQSILDDDSEYIRSLKIYFDANQKGMVDPESTTQNYDTLFSKVQNGQVLFSWWPWLGQSAFNTTTNLNDGKGFMMVPIEGQKIFSYGAEVYGGATFIGIGSNAEDPERIAEFIDWLYSPEGAATASSGPEGLTWEIKDDKPVMTDFGKKALLDGGSVEVPEEYGSGAYKDGYNQLNISTILPVDINPETNAPYDYTMWDSVLAETSNTVQDEGAHLNLSTSTFIVIW